MEKKSKESTPDSSTLKLEYESTYPRALRLRDCIRDQVISLLAKHQIALGVPLEYRIKDWLAIEEKVVRKSLSLSALSDLPDLVGLRAILLFRKDLSEVDSVIRNNFFVISAEDTGLRLGETQFGYQSQHYVIRLLDSWTKIPSYSDLGNLTAEIQVRTLAQHIWSAASHKLQYKREESVPPPLRRAIYRVSALLETVDLEFSRVLEERELYLHEELSIQTPSLLNVDLLRLVMDEMLPAKNKSETETYDSILEELFELGVETDEQLRAIIASELPAALDKDKEFVKEHGKKSDLATTIRDRIGNGVFMLHTGLMRAIMRTHFGASKADAALKKVLEGQLQRRV